MQTAASSNLVLTDLFSFSKFGDLQKQFSHGGFYQQIISGLIRGAFGKQTLTELVNGLVALVRQAYAVRQIRVVEEGCQLLLNLPIGREYESVGRYYQALCIYRRGQPTEARVLLEKVAGELPLRFRARALLAVAATYHDGGDLKSFLLLNVEASRAATSSDLRDLQTFVRSQRHLAMLKSMEGDHRGALSDLENVLPLARAVGRWQPHLIYEHLNSFAIELCEVGRLEEARNVSRIVLASPFADAYPESRETQEEIELCGRGASRSTVAVTRKAAEATSQARQRKSVTEAGVAVTEGISEASNLIILPTARRDASASQLPPEPGSLARVLQFRSRKRSSPPGYSKVIADRLFGLFMAVLDDNLNDPAMMDRLYNVFFWHRSKDR